MLGPTLALSLVATWASAQPGARAPEAGRGCATPLENEDLDRYDVIVDGRLHGSELSAAQRRCFISQLLRTRDRSVRQTFLAALQNDLWEAVRVGLRRHTAKGMAPALRRRARFLLAWEFSEAVIRGEAALDYGVDYEDRATRRAATALRERFAVHRWSGTGTMRLNLRLGSWRLRQRSALSGSANWGELRLPGGGRRAHAYPGVQALSTLSARRRDETLKLGVEVGLERFWRPLADRLLSDVSARGDLAWHGRRRTGLALDLTLRWRSQRFAAPSDEEAFTRRVETLTGRAELSYLLRRAGLVATYDLERRAETTPFLVSNAETHSPALLAHLRFARGHVRLGAGGGTFTDGLRLTAERRATVGQGAKVEGRVELFWQPTPRLKASLVLLRAANRATGDFVGWYPSWWSRGTIIASLGGVALRFVGGFRGYTRELGVVSDGGAGEQRRYKGWASATVSYRPSDRWNLRCYARADYTDQVGHQPFREGTWGAEAQTGYQARRRPDLWLELGVGYDGEHHQQRAVLRTVHAFRLTARARLRF